jgi:hypothetical protein
MLNHKGRVTHILCGVSLTSSCCIYFCRGLVSLVFLSRPVTDSNLMTTTKVWSPVTMTPNYKEQILYSEANSRSATQEIPRLLRNQEVYYHVQKRPHSDL